MAVNLKDIENVTEEDRALNEFYRKRFGNGFLEVGEEKLVLPRLYRNEREYVDNFKLREDDIFIAGHPKSGTSWLHELVYMIVNDLDYEKAKIPWTNRILFFDTSFIFDMKHLPIDLDLRESIQKSESPRIMKTHLPWGLLPREIRNGTKNNKIIHIRRDPKDTCVSYYHHAKFSDAFSGNFDEFCNLFLAGRVNYGPFFANAPSFWKEKERDNLLLLTYGEMRKDLPGVIEKVARFLGKSLERRDDIAKLADHLSFASMKNNAAICNVNTVIDWSNVLFGVEAPKADFFRSGKEGSHKSEMSAEMVGKFDAWIARNLQETDLYF